MTTNRVGTLDEALLSRIHVALHFSSLPPNARAKVWTAFLSKAGVKIDAADGIYQEDLKKLIDRDINGRQIKNATRTANSLALSRGETLKYSHLVEVLDVMDDFATEFHLYGAGGMYS
jgi:AAA+ superfamily predicted ATPase